MQSRSCFAPPVSARVVHAYHLCAHVFGCMYVCVYAEWKCGRRCAHTHAHTTGQTVQKVLTACNHGLTFAFVSHPIARKRPCSSFFTFLRAHARMEERLCMCVYAEWKSERHCARAHTHNPPSLGSVLILDSSPSFARTRERKSEGHRAHIRVHSQSGPDKLSRPRNKLHGKLHKTDSGPQARAHCIERAS